jgi:hypothetical protein
MDCHLPHQEVSIHLCDAFLHLEPFEFYSRIINCKCPPLLIPEQKEKLSEVEQQLKKAEAAQRRRMQVEKAARESEVCFCSLYNFTYTFLIYSLYQK